MKLETFEKCVLIVAKSHCRRTQDCNTCPVKYNHLREDVVEYICKIVKEEK